MTRSAIERAGIRRRLRPIQWAMFLQSVALWVPIEKLFMTEIGFDAASIGAMAAAYSAVVPVLEVPSGILADRWSRRGVLIVAQAALFVSALIGGLSTTVGHYVVAALFLGVFWAMRSGTLESVVYDLVVEETGKSEAFEATIGRLRFIESAALVLSALGGGLLAEFVPLRVVYFATLPFVAAAVVAILWFREPRLHRAKEAEPILQQFRTTTRTLLRQGSLRPLAALMVMGGLLLQGMLEFGPVWMVALAAPAILFGPQWAGLTGALGIGALIGARLRLTRVRAAAAVGGVMIAGSVILTMSRDIALVIVAQAVLVTFVVAASIPLTRLLHDAIPSAVRAGVASGVGTLTWLAFLPFAIGFGAIGDAAGVHRAGWMLVGVAVVMTVLMVLFVRRERAPVVAPPFDLDRFVPPEAREWAGHWSDPPEAWDATRVESTMALTVVEATVAALPTPYKDAIMARDVEGKSPDRAAAEMGVSPEDERTLVHRARGHIRRELDEAFEEKER